MFSVQPYTHILWHQAASYSSIGIVMISPKVCRLTCMPLHVCIEYFSPFPTAHALTENTSLTHLYLRGCDIGADGLALLSSSLRNKSCLQLLGIGLNKFGSKGAEYLGRVYRNLH